MLKTRHLLHNHQELYNEPNLDKVCFQEVTQIRGTVTYPLQAATHYPWWGDYAQGNHSFTF